ncbi:secretory calcium-binding phosphoprotein 8 [Micropterus dolomieu]|uniref:secretory calcium-binding phosphoprotein 8 n=1 Tax=Micropterus dolomieu TaxID=147949 RepID=UPI001E8ED4FF|nr:secretory calcium-binding phosphoprotein 8 [Micropterus dolomieu]
MELLTTALVIVLLTAASAKPIGWRLHHDADITENDKLKEWRSWRFTESSNSKDSSSDSDQSLNSDESSESSKSKSSSEEDIDKTTVVVPTTAMITVTTADRSTLTPEPDTASTDEPTITVTTPPTVPTTDVVVTSPGNVTHCVTKEIPTPAPVTENRGDN